MLKSKKTFIYAGAGLVALIVLGLLFFKPTQGGDALDMGEAAQDSQLYYKTVDAGAVASSNLFSGTVIAKEEQYVYYDSTKGDVSQVLVKQGDTVRAGQNLVQYDTTNLQSAVDQAQRAYNKIARQITDLKTNGATVELSGDNQADNKSVAEMQRTVNNQLVDLQDSLADAEAELKKAQDALNEATEKSTVAGTVVEVNTDVSKTTTGSAQTLVHIVSQGNLTVSGELTEYDLAHIAVGQDIKITSKVYPDQAWTGKISYISNYPKTDGGNGAATTGGAKYPFKADITGQVGDLKQGFSVSIEVVNTDEKLLVPVSALVDEEGTSYVWRYDGKTIQKQTVTLGRADAMNQEITGGLSKGDQVITNPLPTFEEGQKVEADEQAGDY